MNPTKENFKKGLFAIKFNKQFNAIADLNKCLQKLTDINLISAGSSIYYYCRESKIQWICADSTKLPSFSLAEILNYQEYPQPVDLEGLPKRMLIRNGTKDKWSESIVYCILSHEAYPYKGYTLKDGKIYRWHTYRYAKEIPPIEIIELSVEALQKKHYPNQILKIIK